MAPLYERRTEFHTGALLHTSPHSAKIYRVVKIESLRIRGERRKLRVVSLCDQQECRTTSTWMCAFRMPSSTFGINELGTLNISIGYCKREPRVYHEGKAFTAEKGKNFLFALETFRENFKSFPFLTNRDSNLRKEKHTISQINRLEIISGQRNMK